MFANTVTSATNTAWFNALNGLAEVIVYRIHGTVYRIPLAGRLIQIPCLQHTCIQLAFILFFGLDTMTMGEVKAAIFFSISLFAH